MRKKRILVVGMGEVGKAIFDLLNESDRYHVEGYDSKNSPAVPVGVFDYLHVCIPYTGDGSVFVDAVSKYAFRHKPHLIIIHSTVQVGTSDIVRGKTGALVVHSPVRGKHPNLLPSLKVFTKYIGPCSMEAAKVCADHFEEIGIPHAVLSGTKESEVGKILSTTYYGLCIAWHQEMKRICDQFGVSFEQAVTEFNETYNDGYEKMDMPHVRRPVLHPGFIGGHCVMQNIDILKEKFTSDFLHAIMVSNINFERNMGLVDNLISAGKKAPRVSKEFLSKFSNGGDKAKAPSDYFTEIGESGTNNFHGIITDDYNTSLNFPNSVDVYEQMRKGDGDIGAILLASKLPIVRAKKFIEAPDETKEPRAEELQAFAHDLLFNWMSQSFEEFQMEALTFLDFGFLLLRLLQR